MPACTLLASKARPSTGLPGSNLRLQGLVSLQTVVAVNLICIAVNVVVLGVCRDTIAAGTALVLGVMLPASQLGVKKGLKGLLCLFEPTLGALYSKLQHINNVDMYIQP